MSVGVTGAAGASAGIATLEAVDAGLVPTSLIAETRKVYAALRVNPLTVVPRTLEIPSLKTDQLVPLLEYSIL